MITDLIRQRDKAHDKLINYRCLAFILAVIVIAQFVKLENARSEIKRLSDLQISLINTSHERRIDHNFVCEIAETQERLLHHVANYKMKLDWTEPTQEACR
jgi:hypothetical protein